MRPNLWAQVYTIHAASPGYSVPCIYALLPVKSQGAYATMWEQVRNLVGEDADRKRLLTVDFGRAAINAFEETFPNSEVAGCCFHLCQSAFRRVQNLGLSAKFGADGDFKLRVKKLSALAFLPVELAVRGFEQLEEERQEGEMELLAYFEATYIGRRDPAERRRPSPNTNGGTWSRECSRGSSGQTTP